MIAGDVADAFVLDAFQAGAGTPSHMNANEVIANLANERLGRRRGEYAPVHPNDHVNIGQSSNDVTPTAIRLTALAIGERLQGELLAVQRSFRALAAANRAVVKPGRTHLQDAVPITYGARLVKEALASGRPLREVVEARQLVPPDTLRRLLAADALTGPRRLDTGLKRRIRSSPAYRRAITER